MLILLCPLPRQEAEVTVLQRKVRDLEKLKSRQMDVFMGSITRYREAVQQLFGYQMDMKIEETASSKDAANAGATITLRHHHGDSDAVLLFSLAKGRGPELLPTLYSDRLRREVETFLNKFKSVPAFTANLTMELFQKQTQC